MQLKAILKKITSAGAIVLCVLIVKSYLKQRAFAKMALKKWGIKTASHQVPLLGDVPYVLATGAMNGAAIRSLDRHRKYGPYFISWYFNQPVIDTSDPEAMKLIMGAKFDLYERSPLEQEMFDELLGGGLILQSNRGKWKPHRDVLMKGFHQSKLISAVTAVGQKSRKFFQRMPVGELVEIQEQFQELTFDIMCTFALGGDLEEIEKATPGLSVAQLWYDVLDHTQARFIAPFAYWKYYETAAVKRYNFGMKTLKEIINNAIDKALADSSENISLVSFMASEHRDNPAEFTRDDIIQHAITLLFAGHDTTTNLLTFMFYHIGKFPEVKAKCVAEVDELFGDKPLDQLPTITEIKGLRYLRMVAKETLRLYPGAPFRGRCLLKESELVEGMNLPPGLVSLDFLSCHLNPDYWPNPEFFDPERFSEEQEKSRPSHYYLPFGAGPRRCIGEQFAMNEALTAVSVFLRQWDVVTDPANVIERELTLTMRSKYGVHVTLSKRPEVS